jgi:hypothetical protein
LIGTVGIPNGILFTALAYASVAGLAQVGILMEEIAVVFTYVPRILILSKFFYLPTDALVNCLKNNFKIYIKIDVKKQLQHVSVQSSLSRSALFELANITVVKIIN